MDPDPKILKTVDSVRRLKANAERLGRTDIVKACLERIFELEGADITDPIEKRLWQAVAAYEQTLYEKHGKAVKASYTRRKIKAKGAIRTLSDWAEDPKVTPGFEALVEAGQARFTGEYVVLEFASSFNEKVVKAAREKLLYAGLQEASLPKERCHGDH